MLSPLKTNSSYSRSGTLFSRSLLVRETLSGATKAFFVFETEGELKSAAPVLTYGLGHPLNSITTEWELLDALNRDSGFFAATVGIFDARIRPEYKRTKLVMTLKRGESYTISSLVEKLLDLGYAHSKHLSHIHTYKIEGDTLSVRTARETYLLSFFGDELDDVRTEWGSNLLPEVSFFSSKSDGIGELEKFDDSVGKLMGNVPVFFFDLDFVPQKNEIKSSVSKWIAFENSESSIDLAIEPYGLDGLENLENLMREENTDVHLFTKLGKTVEQFLSYNGLVAKSITNVPKVWLESFKFAESWRLVVCLCDDVLNHLFIKRRTKRKSKAALDLLLSLSPGDYVVHFEHGIGKFVEVVHKEINGIQREYLTLEYAGDDKLHVPITELYRLTKYLGEENPPLHRLGGDAWKKSLERTEDEVEKTAKELLDIYAKRHIAKGFAFPPFREKEAQFRASFKYEHTPDQGQSIEEIFLDMESSEPMDRLLSGDVGFGKTEVAMNAAYKAYLAGKQVAVVSPLVVLAIEHGESFLSRFAPFGAKIGIMTRMTDAKEARDILKWLKNGTIDIVVGTHRLLQEDVEFRRLGLLIVDEEHKFGVLDKERITKLKSGIDLLSLSATPIPRSLNMALSGMKKISLLTTPPPGKKPIHTIVAKWNEEFVKETIDRELERGGQVIFLHNRIASLEGIAKELRRIVGKKLNIVIIHGQMDGETLENHLLDFKSGKYDILLSTTVIENGVNFLRANTILIDNADEFGLAQLHQLRGRVGRKDVQASCALLYRKEHLNDDSKKRLLAIVENSRLWAGFEIAMRDLEIRGAGEILGIKQSGRAKETGISLYLKLLESKVEELRTGTKTKSIETKIELDIPCVIDDSLFASEADKMHFYRSIESIADLEDLESSEESFSRTWEDSDPNIANLFLLLRARILLYEYKVQNVKKVLSDYVFDFGPDTTTEDIRKFLDIDTEDNFLVQSLRRIRSSKGNYRSDLDFLQKLVYSMETVKHG